MSAANIRESWLAATLGAEQDRWFHWVPVAVGIGSAAYFASAREPGLVPLACAALIAAAIYALTRKRGLWVVLTGLLAATTAGALVAKLRTEIVRAPVLAEMLSNVDVAGWVELVEPRTTRGQRLTVRIAHMSKLTPGEYPTRIRVRALTQDATLAPGQPVAFRASLSPPPSPAYPGGYDFGFTAYYMGLGAVGAALGPITRTPDLGAPPLTLRLRALIEGVRHTITQRIMATLPNETGAIAAALITGERGGISEDTNTAYRDSGLFHVLSISGLHMVIMAGAIFFVARLALAAIPMLALRYPIKKWAATIALVGALGYLLISGAAFATVRSYIMISVMFFAVLLDRPAVALRNVALSALVILLLYPESVIDPGFQMSFAAVTALIAVHEALRVRREHREQIGRGAPPLAAPLRALGAILLSTVIASVAVAPFSIYHFHNTQTLALIANVVAIPVCNLIVMPAALAVLLALPFGIELLPLTVMGWGVDAMTWVAGRVAMLPGAVARLPAISPAGFGLMVTGGLWLLLWSRNWRVAGLPIILAGVAAASVIDRPDVLIGRDGQVFAVRAQSGALTLPPQTETTFEAIRWLEVDGDERARRVRATKSDREKPAGDTITCDSFGCATRVGPRALQVLNGPGGLRDACGVSEILILKFSTPDICGADTANTHRQTIDSAGYAAYRPSAARPLVVTAHQLAQNGVHALYLRGDTIHTISAEDRRAARPWGSRGDRADDPRRRTAIADTLTD